MLTTLVFLNCSYCSISGSGLECYVCTDQERNGDKCLNTIKTCEQGEDVCLSEIKWGSKLVCCNNFTSHFTKLSNYSSSFLFRKPHALMSHFVMYPYTYIDMTLNKYKLRPEVILGFNFRILCTFSNLWNSDITAQPYSPSVFCYCADHELIFW